MPQTIYVFDLIFSLRIYTSETGSWDHTFGARWQKAGVRPTRVLRAVSSLPPLHCSVSQHALSQVGPSSDTSQSNTEDGAILVCEWERGVTGSVCVLVRKWGRRDNGHTQRWMCVWVCVFVCMCVGICECKWCTSIVVSWLGSDCG